MPVTWTVPQPAVVYPPVVDPALLGGEDVAVINGDHVLTVAGTLQTLKGVDAAKQSVVREAAANPGSMPRLPEWGYGLPALLFQGNTKSSRGEIESRTRNGLRRNPRIKNINNVSTIVLKTGIALNIDCDATDGALAATIALAPESTQ